MIRLGGATQLLRAARLMPWRAAVTLGGLLPGPARRVAARVVSLAGRATGGPASPRGGVLRVLARWLDGEAERAADDAVRLGRAAEPDGAARLAQFLVAIDEPARADTLADRLGGPSLAADIARWETARALGRLVDAEAALAAAVERRPGDRGLRRLLERASGERRVVDPTWIPTLRSGAARRRGSDPVRGRALHVLTNSLPHRQSGYTIRSLEVARSQRASGLDPIVATRAGFPGPGVRGVAPIEHVDGIAHHRIEPALDRLTGPDVVVERTADGIAAIVAATNPALLHPATNHPNVQAALAVARAAGLPVVYEVRGFLEDTWISRVGEGRFESDRYEGSRAVETAAMLAADAVVTLSETMRDDIVERGVAREKVTVVPNAVDVEAFRPRPRDDAFRARLGLEPGDTVLGYVSSLVAYEGVRHLIDATRILRDHGAAVRTLIVGDGAILDELRVQARALGLADIVRFTGRVPRAEVLDHYAAIDVFVVPRTNDRVCQLVTPLKPYEAMAMARPLVVSGVGALREIVIPGETGFIFEPEDAADLVRAVEPLLDDAALRERIGGQARAWVAAHRTWALNGARYRALYESLGAA